MRKIKRQLTLLLLILANSFLLVHGVLPHSHHDGIVCFSLEELKHQHHCSENHSDIGHCCCEHEKGHHHSNQEDCDLKDVVLRQNNDLHEEILPCPNCLSLMFVLYLPNEFYLDMPQLGKWLHEKPYVNNYIPPFVGTVKSLRAPPVSYLLA
ncbi:ABC-type nickel/cobalt efflux system permease component RcnA [Dysgonomonas hofstadii]|uniref:ABC-type nickel/cobalt efflux system permease component RcnA n=1 Tax=Dysgonomonas hofstadii TaxID=637886 RepID=A0A840CUR7_9BACT|nr:hypothetical protein [Dysgonomonas hofstadii]MBB4035503.1 ABC-type nickel/cobalt efflux system permease component RcnA [Dysgonomonas hofstadii]